MVLPYHCCGVYVYVTESYMEPLVQDTKLYVCVEPHRRGTCKCAYIHIQIFPKGSKYNDGTYRSQRMDI